MTDRDPVVVGVDGSAESSRAVRWAADLAQRNDLPLLVLHSWIWPLYEVPLTPPPGAPRDAGLRNQAERVVHHAVALAREQTPHLQVTGRLVVAGPVAALHKYGETASAIVIAGHDHGRFETALLGSVGVDLAGHTRCPLVVVRGATEVEGPVIVGVDDSPRSAEAVEFAFHAASVRGARLRAVRTWDYPTVLPSWPGGLPEIMRELEARARLDLEEALAGARDRWPGVEVEFDTPPGSAGHALVERSGSAQLLVVGSRGRGGFRGLVLGSTSHALIHHARCPVAVVPHGRDLDGVDVDEEFDEVEIAL